jgi:Rod binding domain-containing protein
MSLIEVLQQLAKSAGQNKEQHIEQVAQQAPPDLFGKGIAEAFRSDQTPAFNQMVGQMFGQSSATQQAGIVNQLIKAVGPAVLAAAVGGALGKMLKTGQTEVTPEQAKQISQADIEKLAGAAQQHSPTVIDQAAAFYAEHPTLVKVLGGVAAAIAINKMRDQLLDRR